MPDLGAGPAPAQLLVVDAPNVDQRVASLYGRAPVRDERMDFDALVRWFLATAPAVADSQATMFTNVPANPSAALHAWVQALTTAGWRVFAKPKSTPRSDVDDQMVEHLHARAWTRVIVVSHDARCFAAPLERLAAAGTEVGVVGMREMAGSLAATAGVAYVDIDEIAGLFKLQPPRVRLADLPAAGRWFEPTTTLQRALAQAA